MGDEDENVIQMHSPPEDLPPIEEVVERYQELGANMMIVHNAGFGRWVAHGVDRHNQIATVVVGPGATLEDTMRLINHAGDE